MKSLTTCTRIAAGLLAASFLTIGLSAQQNLKPHEIIERFAAKESEFRKVWEQYTYTQKISFQELGPGRSVRARREMEIEVYFTEKGERKTRKISDRGRLRSVQVTKEDIENAVSLQPFALTTEELPFYEITFVKREYVDELATYVFDVEPRRMQLKRRYFKGRIWVDDLDFQIVMTRGKAVPEGKQRFPKFETIREQIDGDFWFPTWSEADDYLQFGRNSVHIYELVTYSNYKKFGVGATIEYGPVEEKKPPNP